MAKHFISNTDFVKELLNIVGENSVVHEPQAIRRLLRDNSWLSPMLSEHIRELGESTGESLDVKAVVSPCTLEELKAVVSLAVRHEVPLIPRGGGTSNFGQTTPLHGGVVLDIRQMKQVLRVSSESITAEAGALQGALNEVAKQKSRELTLLTTTYDTATVAGWVAGGHVGLGTNRFGTIWDGNVKEVELLTAHESPQTIRLKDEDVLPVLHTYGTTGIITEVTLPLVEARDWADSVVTFDTFDSAAQFVYELSCYSDIPHQVAAAQESPIPTAFKPFRHLIQDGQSLVLLIVDVNYEEECRALAQTYGGQYVPVNRDLKSGKTKIAYMVYGHRMLWVKKLAPQSAFLHCYFSESHLFEQIRALEERFGNEIWLELKFMRSKWLRELQGLHGDGMVPAAVICLVRGERESLTEIMRFCYSIGMTYQDPHTFALEETGILPEMGTILSFKEKVDPKGLLNPGKLTFTDKGKG